MRDTLNRIIAHCGGLENISETKLMMAHRCAYLEAELTFMAAKNVRLRELGGEPTIDAIESYARISGNHRRCAEPLGWERTPKDTTPTLSEYINSKYAKAEDAEEADAC